MMLNFWWGPAETLVFLVIDLETVGEIFWINSQLWVKAVILQSKNNNSWSFALDDDRRGRRGLFQDADTSVLPHQTLSCIVWGLARNAGAPWAMASPEELGSPWSKEESAGSVKKGPGDPEKLFLKRYQGGIRLSLWHMASAVWELHSANVIPRLSD